MSLDHEVPGLLAWAKGQPFNNVMCVLQLAVICAAIHFGLTVVIPEERRAILDGSIKIEEMHTKQLEKISSTYERTLDRFSKPETKVAEPN